MVGSLPEGVEIWAWDGDVLSTFEERTAHARRGQGILDDHHRYDHDPKVEYRDGFIPMWGGFELTRSSISDIDYKVVHRVHLGFRDKAEPLLNGLAETSQELNHVVDSMVDVLDDLLLSHILPGN